MGVDLSTYVALSMHRLLLMYILARLSQSSQEIANDKYGVDTISATDLKIFSVAVEDV